MADTNARTVPIRIALAVDERGNWGCIGFTGMTHDHTYMAADNLDGGQVAWYWLTADVAPPDANTRKEVAATVQSAAVTTLPPKDD